MSSVVEHAHLHSASIRPDLDVRRNVGGGILFIGVLAALASLGMLFYLSRRSREAIQD